MLEIDDILFPIQSLKLSTAACYPIPVYEGSNSRDKEGPKRWNKPKKHTKTQEVN